MTSQIRFNLLLLNDEYREKETIHEKAEKQKNDFTAPLMFFFQVPIAFFYKELGGCV